MSCPNIVKGEGLLCLMTAMMTFPPGRQRLVLQYAEVEERRPQAHGQVHGCHLVLLHQGCDITQEVEQRLQHFPVLIRHQQNGGADGLQPLFLWNI